jgi:hypothetical protein
MRPCSAFVGLALLLVAGGVAHGQPANKRPVSPPAAQAKAEKLIQELFGPDLARAAKVAADKARVAQLFLAEGRDTTDDAAGRYVLLTRAHRLASEAGDVATALQAADELAQGFLIPPAEALRLKLAALTAAAKSDATPEAYQTVVDSALLLLDDTLAADDFPASLALLDAADRAAHRLKSVPLVATIRRRAGEVKALQKEFARWEPFARKLAANPDDAEAGYQIGIYQALIKGNWERGLPLLARGPGPLAKVARAELDAKTPGQRADAAGRWQAFGRQAEGVQHANALMHAYQLYLQALADADVSGHDAIEARLQKLLQELPPEYRVGEITAELRKIDLPSGPVYDAALSPDGRRLIAAAYDGSLRLIDARTGKEQRRLDGHTGKVWTVAFAPGGRRVVSGGFDGSVGRWDLAAGRELRRFPGHADYVRSGAVSADGKRVLSGGDDRLIRLWDADTGAELAKLAGHDHFVWSVALSRDGRRALSGGLDKTVRLWDLDAGRELKKLVGHGDTVLAVAFAPDGRHALSGSTDRTLKLWDLATGECLQTFAGHTGYVQGVAFAPDGRRVLSAGADNTVRLWDVATGRCIVILVHLPEGWVAFTPDGRSLVLTSEGANSLVWQVDLPADAQQNVQDSDSSSFGTASLAQDRRLDRKALTVSALTLAGLAIILAGRWLRRRTLT